MSRVDHRASVARACEAVRRELFVPQEQRRHAHDDRALSIGWGQTISQPTLVRYMTEQLELTRESRVLEIGTGSGYQTAILAELAREVYTIERITELSESAWRLLRSLGYQNVQFRVGDGALGWPEDAPFEAILVTAAATQVPAALLAQLDVGGRMVAPIGPTPESQTLFRFDKDWCGNVETRTLCDVRFVPLITPTLPD